VVFHHEPTPLQEATTEGTMHDFAVQLGEMVDIQKIRQEF
jgi:hypothetical protein